jgi:hypothetical protein
MTVRKADGAILVATFAASLVACGSKESSEVGASITPGTTVPAAASMANPVFSAAQVEAAMSGCGGAPSFVDDTATPPALSAFVGAWLRCGPPGQTGDVGYLFTASSELRFLVADGSEVTTAYSPTTFDAQFPLIPTTSAPSSSDPDGARISLSWDHDGEIYATFADHDTWELSAAFVDSPPRMTIYGEFDTDSSAGTSLSGSTYIYVRIAP